MPRLGLGTSHGPVALLVAGLALLAACGSQGDAPTPTPPSAEALRDRAVAALRQLSTVHFEIAHEAGGTDLGGGLSLLSAEGDALFPDPPTRPYTRCSALSRMAHVFTRITSASSGESVAVYPLRPSNPMIKSVSAPRTSARR